MLVSLIRYLKGYLKICVSGYSPERFLNLCKNKKIEIWGLESSHNTYKMYMKISGFRKLKPILKKTKTKVTIEERLGLPFFFYRYRRRKLFFCGAILCCLLVYAMTFFVWKIDVQGNVQITDEVLIEYLETKKIYHGMLKQNVDCAQISKEIRKDFDNIIWVSVSKEGTELMIHVKENTDIYKEAPIEESPCDLISDKTGVIVSMVTRSGVPRVQVGSQVVAGDVLISGTVDVLNDAKEVVTQHTVVADGDIVLETTVQYMDAIVGTYYEKEYTNKKRTVLYFKFGDSVFQFGLGKHSYKKYEQKIEETQLKLGANFYLPIYLGQKEYREYKLKPKEYSKAEMESILEERFLQYCDNLEQNGVIVSGKELHLSYSENEIKASTTLILQEQVGIQRKIVDF